MLSYLNMKFEMTMKEPPAGIISKESDDCETSIWYDHGILFRSFVQFARDITLDKEKLSLKKYWELLFVTSFRMASSRLEWPLSIGNHRCIEYDKNLPSTQIV